MGVSFQWQILPVGVDKTIARDSGEAPAESSRLICRWVATIKKGFVGVNRQASATPLY
ncbi:hypothetical protein DESC_290140 [Desulfosarcina cetonica]|uniref:hypothetical protein n=1 Tax=Desulfosarcina cetonica TaxID=90730 RepID=UPI0012EEB0EC|nr:hypothetical protein [Desulfosarcina cetonica]VTR65070.1 hypothetical protein DESC_290140 [Desulfosarcina cetonica]